MLTLACTPQEPGLPCRRGLPGRRRRRRGCLWSRLVSRTQRQHSQRAFVLTVTCAFPQLGYTPAQSAQSGHQGQ